MDDRRAEEDVELRGIELGRVAFDLERRDDAGVERDREIGEAEQLDGVEHGVELVGADHVDRVGDADRPDDLDVRFGEQPVVAGVVVRDDDHLRLDVEDLLGDRRMQDGGLDQLVEMADDIGDRERGHVVEVGDAEAEERLQDVFELVLGDVGDRMVDVFDGSAVPVGLRHDHERFFARCGFHQVEQHLRDRRAQDVGGEQRVELRVVERSRVLRVLEVVDDRRVEGDVLGIGDAEDRERVDDVGEFRFGDVGGRTHGDLDFHRGEAVAVDDGDHDRRLLADRRGREVEQDVGDGRV